MLTTMSASLSLLHSSKEGIEPLSSSQLHLLAHSKMVSSSRFHLARSDEVLEVPLPLLVDAQAFADLPAGLSSAELEPAGRSGCDFRRERRDSGALGTEHHRMG